MIGEFEFEGIFTEHDDPDSDKETNIDNARNIPFPYYSSVLFVIFVFVMSIIISNLLVGLAVDDIKEIQEHAELEKLSMHVRLILETERFLPHIRCCLTRNFLHRYMKPLEELSKVKMTCMGVRDILSDQKIIQHLSEREKQDSDTDLEIFKNKLKEIEDKLRDISEENQEIIALLKKRL